VTPARLIAFPRSGQRWLVAHALGDSAVRRINVGWFCEFGSAVYAVANIPLGSSLEGNVAITLSEAKEMLPVFNDENTPLALSVSRSTAEELSSAIQFALASEQPKKIELENISHARQLATRLQIILAEELPKQAIYHVFPKRAYDTNILIEDATKVLSDDTRKMLSTEAERDIASAGRCLAFELPTAAVFHLMRALEATIRDYYAVVLGIMPKIKMRNWGSYIKNLREKGGDAIVLNALTQIKDLHRNPVLHPELNLEMDEALSLLGIVESAISAMFADMQKRGAQLGTYEKTRVIALPADRVLTRTSES
jgi:hypothetical protein